MYHGGFQFFGPLPTIPCEIEPGRTKLLDRRSTLKVVIDPAFGVCLGPGTQKVQLKLSNDQMVESKNCWFMDTWVLGIRLHAIIIFTCPFKALPRWSTRSGCSDSNARLGWDAESGTCHIKVTTTVGCLGTEEYPVTVWLHTNLVVVWSTGRYSYGCWRCYNPLISFCPSEVSQCFSASSPSMLQCQSLQSRTLQFFKLDGLSGPLEPVPTGLNPAL